MKKVLYLASNNKIQFESRLFLKKECFEYLILPLKGFKKILYIFFNIFYPLSRLNHNQIYLLLNLILRQKDKLITYSYASKKVQELSKRFKFFKIVQIQNGALHKELQKDLNRRLSIYIKISI